MTIKTNPFVRRQTKSSKFAHFEGTWEELERLTETHISEAKPGYRDGVVLVPVPPDGFFTSVVEVTTDSKLWASFEPRRRGEDPLVQVTARGNAKTPAAAVDIVLYRHDVLAEGNEHSCDADWEIVSINARPTKEDVPMDPVTMARNFLQMEGGTKGEFSADDFAKAIVYWATHCQVG